MKRSPRRSARSEIDPTSPLPRARWAGLRADGRLEGDSRSCVSILAAGVPAQNRAMVDGPERGVTERAVSRIRGHDARRGLGPESSNPKDKIRIRHDRHKLVDKTKALTTPSAHTPSTPAT